MFLFMFFANGAGTGTSEINGKIMSFSCSLYWIHGSVAGNESSSRLRFVLDGKEKVKEDPFDYI